MSITRRRFIASAAAIAGASALAPARVWANASLQLGAVQIDTLSDGHLSLPANFVFGDLPADQADAIRRKYGLTGDRVEPPCNVTLMRDGTNTVLFDTGSGANFQPTAGELVDALDAIGVAPEDVTHVVFTHGHPDHLWGILDDFDEPVFYEAQHMMGRVDFDYWRDPNTVDQVGEARASFAVGAKRRLDQMAEQFTFFEDGQEVLPGIASVLTPGHTPGHMSFEIRSGSESVMVLGDCIANQHVSFERPDWFYGSDQDEPTAAETRVKLLDRLAAEQMRVIGYHMPFPGIGRAEALGGGSYRFVADG